MLTRGHYPKAASLWEELVGWTQLTPMLSDKWWNSIVSYYDGGVFSDSTVCTCIGGSRSGTTPASDKMLSKGPARYYHTMKHLEELCGFFQLAKPMLVSPPTVALTLFFHDIIYNPKAIDNEEKSAATFEEFAEEAHGNMYVAKTRPKVVEYILATKHHTKVDVEKADSDMLFFLDMDLGILASTSERYRAYSEEIWQEYSHYKRCDYCKGRAAVLEGFLAYLQGEVSVDNGGGVAPSPLFKTKYFREKFTKIAAENLRWEIDMLKHDPSLAVDAAK